jgi:hypothetical protein
MVKRLALGIVVGAVLGLAWVAWRGTRPPTPPPTTPGNRWLAVYGSQAHELVLVSDPAQPASTVRPLPCAGLPEHAVYVGVREDDVVALDVDEPAVLLLSRELLRRVATGSKRCGTGDRSLVRRSPLHSGKPPHGGTNYGNRLYVTYFTGNLVEDYAWVPAHGDAPATLLLVRDIRFGTEENLALTDLIVVGIRMFVSASGAPCHGPECRYGHYYASHLFSLPLVNTVWPFVDARPDNVRAMRLYHHPDGDVWLINAGDPNEGYGSVQQLGSIDPPELEAEVRLPVNSSPVAGYPIGLDHFVVLQSSGEHVFVFDVRDGRLVKILRYDGHQFAEVALDIASLPASSRSDFQQVVGDPDRPGELLFVDKKRDQLLRVRTEGPMLTPLGEIPLGRAPDWAFWL